MKNLTTLLAGLLVLASTQAFAWGSHGGNVDESVFENNVSWAVKGFVHRLVKSGRLVPPNPADKITFATPTFIDGERLKVNGAESLWSLQVNVQAPGAEPQQLLLAHVTCSVDVIANGHRYGTTYSYYPRCHVIGDRSGD